MKTSDSSAPGYLRNLAALVLTVAALYFAKPLLAPLAVAILLTFVLVPVVTFLQRLGLGRVPAVIVTSFATAALIGLAVWSLTVQLRGLAAEIPTHRKEIEGRLAAIRGTGTGPFSEFLQMVQEIASGKTDADEESEHAQERVVVTPQTSSFEKLANAVGPVVEPLATLGLVAILVVFMLIQREDLRNRVIGVLGHGHLTGTTRVLIDAAQRLSRYLFTQLLINLAFGGLLGLGYFLIGVPYFYLWGFMAALLRFIPYVGSWAAVAFPLVLSFAVSPSGTQPIEVLVLFLFVDTVTGNVVEPLLFGHGAGVSPIALLIAAAFWTWIWGTLGLVLSTPLTVCLVVLGQHVPRLRFLQLLLGVQPALPPSVGFYQRLLARDAAEAGQMAAKFVATAKSENVYDALFLPALALAQRDLRSGAGNADEEQSILETMGMVLGSLAAEHALPAANGSCNRGGPLVLGCPARNALEEQTLSMLARFLTPTCCFKIIAAEEEIEDHIERDQPAVLVIGVLPPGGLRQAAYLCKHLRGRYPKLAIVVGVWGAARKYENLRVHLRSAGASDVTTTLGQTASRVQTLAGVSASAAKQPQPAEAH